MTARVNVDVSAARAGVREAISVSGNLYDLNPGEATAIADDIRTASDIVDRLCPRRELQQ